MKKIIYLILLVICSYFLITYQSSSNQNEKYFVILPMAVFMIFVYSIMKKIPSKDDENDDEKNEE